MYRGGGGDFRNLTMWKNSYEFKIRFGGIQNWLKQKDHWQLKETIQNLENLDIKKIKPFALSNLKENELNEQKQYIQKYIFDFVKKYPQTQFHFIIPTYFRLFYLLPHKNSIPDSNSKIFKMIKWFVLESNQYHNSKVYGFDDLNYADDIKNYKDLTHYESSMNSLQLSAIAKEKHILTPQNIDDYLNQMENKIKNFPLKELVQKVQKLQQN